MEAFWNLQVKYLVAIRVPSVLMPSKKITSYKGAKHAPRISKGQHEKVTVLACASASGTTIPPLFVFKKKSGRVPQLVQEEAPAGTMFTTQKSGWIDKDIYLKWFSELFLPSIQKERPILLIVDGHKSHVTEDLINKAVENKVIAFCLPAMHLTSYSILTHLCLVH